MPRKTTTKKEKNTTTLWLHFTNPKEVNLINKIKKELKESGRIPGREFKKIITQSVESDSFAQSFLSIRQDIYYSLRKATFASLSPFYLKLDEMQVEIFSNLQLLNKKIDFLINWSIDKPESFNKFDENQSLKLIKEINIFQQEKLAIAEKLKDLKSKNRSRKKEILGNYENFLASEKVNEKNNRDTNNYNDDESENAGVEDEDKYKNY